MSHVIQLFPRHSPSLETEEPKFQEHIGSDIFQGARRDAGSAIRYCLESLLQDAEAFGLTMTRAALAVAITATLEEMD